MWNILIFYVVLVFSFILFLNIATLKYKNPYRLTMIFGKKGSGKSTTLTRLALEAKKAGKEVFANVPLPGAHLIKESDIGFFDIPPESVLIVDEAGMIWDNRHFKNFKPEVRDWFKLHVIIECEYILHRRLLILIRRFVIYVMICILWSVVFVFLHMGVVFFARSL